MELKSGEMGYGNRSEDIGSIVIVSIEHHTNTSEGGVLSGRNPFEFNGNVPLPSFIIQLLVIVGMSRLIKFILSPIKQPAVIAEIISGIILGPTAFGRIPSFTQIIFPKQSLPFLNLMSNFGLVLFLFLVGLELDPRMLRQSIRQSLIISLAGMALPFALGVGTSYALYTFIEPSNHSINFTSYFLFLGVAMAITAFPVLARILTELNLLKTKVGRITVSAAAVDDATSWCLLALVISIINAGSNLIALYVFLLAIAYSLFLLLAIRPFFIWILRRSGAFRSEPSQFCMFLALSLMFISAFVTDAIGIHAIFGGFLAGIMMPHEGGFAYHVTHKLEDIVSVLFLPLYFALSGLRTEIGSLNDITSWAMVLLVISVACVGKIIGCTLAARSSKMSWRESLTVGSLMNCKGLVELIVLNLGYDAGVISHRTFAIMVIMALVTTFLTVPLVRFLYPPEYHEHEDEMMIGSTAANSSTPPEASILISVNAIEQVPSILSIIHLLELPYLKMLSTGHTPMWTDKEFSQMTDGHGHGSHGCLPQLLRKTSTNTTLTSLSPRSSELNLSGKDSHSKHLRSQLVINALRLIEITERDSSVMLQTSQDALREDPVMKMISTFCDLTALNIRGLIKVVTINKFAEMVVSTATDVNAKYTIIPWSGSGSLIEDRLTPIQNVFMDRHKRRMSLHTPIQHANFIQELLTIATSPILILVDRGLVNPNKSRNITRLVPHYQNIYLPFFGGIDDREALEIIMGLVGGSGIRMNVVRYRIVKKIDEMEDECDIGAGTSQDTLDENLIAKYFGTEQLRNSYSNLNYKEIDHCSPLTMAIRLLKELNSNDLVIIGRNPNLTSAGNGLNVRGGDEDRRRVLGDVTESILLSECNSSVLIVQGQRPGRSPIRRSSTKPV